MVIGKVVDEIVATQKVDSLFGQKLLLVQPLDLEGADWGEAVLAIDGLPDHHAGFLQPSTGSGATRKGRS